MDKERQMNNEKLKAELVNLHELIDRFNTHCNYSENLVLRMKDDMTNFVNEIDTQRIVQRATLEKLVDTWFDCLEAVGLCSTDSKDILISEKKIGDLLIEDSENLEKMYKNIIDNFTINK
jgi:hypothetical protein